MCPFRYLFHVLCFLLTNFFINSCAGWKATFDPNEITVKTSSKQRVNLTLSDLDNDIISRINDRNFLQIHSSNEEIAKVTDQEELKFVEIERVSKTWRAEFDLSGVFIGSSRVRVELKRQNNQSEFSNESLPVTVIRPKRIIDSLFIYSVIILMSILYINFGAALSLSNIKQILKRPIGPLICCIGQFIFMPLISFAIGSWLFQDASNPDQGHALALGLFFTGVSPGGGASNVWTLVLGGNIDLSIAMTTISTLAAFGMMPLWVFTLGGVIFERAELGVPYSRIASTAIGLLIPLMIGVAIRRYKPNVANFLVRILKPLSAILIIFIVIFAIITNFYIFKLFSWQIVLAGIGLPWLGYMFGWIVSKIFRQSNADAIAVSVETGVQNTGIAIFLLTFALEQPMADLTTVVPVSVAVMTPFPLLAVYIAKKIKSRFSSDEDSKNFKRSPMVESITNESI